MPQDRSDKFVDIGEEAIERQWGKIPEASEEGKEKIRQQMKEAREKEERDQTS